MSNLTACEDYNVQLALLSTLLIVTASVALTFNALTVIVILVHWRTLLNTWVNWLILSIAVADFCMTTFTLCLLMMETIVLCSFNLNEVMTISLSLGLDKVLVTAGQDLGFCASVFGMATLSVVRLRVTTSLQRSRASSRMSLDRRRYFLFDFLKTSVIWICAGLYVSTHFVLTSYQCAHNLLSVVTVLAGPSLVTVVSYACLARTLRKRPRLVVLPPRHWRRRRRTWMALSAYCCVNTFCMFPKILTQILLCFPSCRSFYATPAGQVLQTVFHWMTNILLPCVNPLLLYYISSMYNACVQQLLRRLAVFAAKTFRFKQPKLTTTTT